MENKIAFIAPYKKLGELFTEVCQQLNKDIPVYIGDLEQGVDIAVELEEKGLDAVISRGGTALAIKNKLIATPVVEIQVSGFDLIRALHQARQQTKRIAVAGFDPFTYGIEELEDIMGVKLKVLTIKENWYDQPHYIEKELGEFKKLNYNWLVGDNISVKTAQKMGMNTLLIRSGKEALAQAIMEAERITEVRKKEMEKAKISKSIVDFAYEGIISIDKDGIIQTFNPCSEKIFDKKAHKVIGRNILEILPEMDFKEIANDGYKKQGKIMTAGEKKIVGNIIPIKIDSEVIGVIIIFQEVSRIQKMEKKIRNELYVKGYTAENTFDDIIGESKVFLEIKEEARDYAQVELPLLIDGETGTGKELFAQAVHNASSRRNKPFVAFNCATLPEKLLESELFGYVKGAFTGASEEGKSGLFEQAHTGTIFLDEIGEISKAIQTRLLRVFEERKIRKIGDNKLTPIDVRIILATNKSLSRLVEEDKFREDLYYRINVLNLNLPPLRKRREDIPLLVDFFIKKATNKVNKIVEGISGEGMKILQDYYWPGNVRQLDNVIERLVVRTKKNYIMSGLIRETIESLESHSKEVKTDGEEVKTKNNEENTVKISLNKSLEEIEKEIIKMVVEKEKGNKTAAAKKLKIGRTTLWRKIN